MKSLILTADQKCEKSPNEGILKETKQSSVALEDEHSIQSGTKTGTDAEGPGSDGINSHWSEDDRHTEMAEENSINTSGEYAIMDQMFSEHPILLARFK